MDQEKLMRGEISRGRERGRGVMKRSRENCLYNFLGKKQKEFFTNRAHRYYYDYNNLWNACHCIQWHVTVFSHMSLYLVTCHCIQSHFTVFSHITLYSVTFHCIQSHVTVFSHGIQSHFTFDCIRQFSIASADVRISGIAMGCAGCAMHKDPQPSEGPQQSEEPSVIWRVPDNLRGPINLRSPKQSERPQQSESEKIIYFDSKLLFIWKQNIQILQNCPAFFAQIFIPVFFYYFRMLAQSYAPNLYTPPLYYNFFIILSPLFFATISIPIRFEPRIHPPVEWELRETMTFPRYTRGFKGVHGTHHWNSAQGPPKTLHQLQPQHARSYPHKSTTSPHHLSLIPPSPIRWRILPPHLASFRMRYIHQYQIQHILPTITLIIIFYFENVAFFHAKLGSEVYPTIDNQTTGNTLQDLFISTTSEKLLSASYPPMGIGASLWWRGLWWLLKMYPIPKSRSGIQNGNPID